MRRHMKVITIVKATAQYVPQVNGVDLHTQFALLVSNNELKQKIVQKKMKKKNDIFQLTEINLFSLYPINFSFHKAYRENF